MAHSIAALTCRRSQLQYRSKEHLFTSHLASEGWQQQPVGTKKYHFILPCIPNSAPHMEMVSRKDVSQAAADAAYDQYSSSSAFESSAHLLHGVLHMNGFGHLLRINGLEGGSAHLTGKSPQGFFGQCLLMLTPGGEMWQLLFTQI